MTIRPWTILEQRRAVELRRQRHTIAYVARVLNRTHGAVSVYLSRLGATRRVTRRRRPGQFLASVRRLARPGVSDRDIARRLHTTHQEVCRARRKLGIPAGVTSSKGFKHRKPLGGIVSSCWSCNRTTRSGGNNSLAQQGWYKGQFSGFGVDEVYCAPCIVKYGPPSLWAPPSVSA